MSVPQSPSQSKRARRQVHKRRISEVPSPEANTRQPHPQGGWSRFGSLVSQAIHDAVAKNAYNSRTSLGVAFPFHRIEETPAESVTAERSTQAGKKKEEEEEEEEDEEERASAPDFRTRQDIPGAGNRRTPTSSSTERQDQSQSPCTQGPEDAATGLGGPTADTQPDSDLDDEGYAESNRTSVSFATMVDSEVHHAIEENGRLYPNFGEHEYGLPMDVPEQERDTSIDVADKFPSARVIGVDVAPIQPLRVPPNCEFEIADVEGKWRLGRNSFDFIHMRDPLFVVRDWEKLVDHCFEYLKPGGWCELACTYLAPASDDGSMPDSSASRWVCERMIEASKAFGAPADCPLYFADYIRPAGFVNVTQRTCQIPSCTWSDDERQMEIGGLEQVTLRAGASAFGLRVFGRAFGWTQAETEGAMVGFRKDSAKHGYRQYCPHFVVYGQEPPNKVEP